MESNDHDVMSTEEIVKTFNPAWFATVMGTAVVPLAVSFLDPSLSRPLAAFFTLLSIVMFVVLAVPWSIRWVRHRREALDDLSHPVAANFYPTFPIALVIIALDLMKYDDLFMSEAASRELAWFLWLIGTAGIYVFGFIVLPRVYHHETITLKHANFGWYIPPVSKLLVPVAGLELAHLFPERHDFAFGVSLVSFGIGVFLFLFVGSLVYQRYVLEALPSGRLAATSFIAIAPTAIIAVVLFKLKLVVEAHASMGLDPTVISTLAVLGIVLAWGFAAWAFGMALIVVLSHIVRKDLPYALSWWALTFPSGALAVASGVTWKATGFAFVHWFYLFSVVFLLVVWTIVAIRTLVGIATRKVFIPAH
ncbi:MAG: hypothetical protein ABFR95_09855 [Actinomycetota bacterium]